MKNRFAGAFIAGLLLATQPSFGQELSRYEVEVHNQTNKAITYLYASPQEYPKWGKDILNGPVYIIEPSKTVKLTLPNYCIWDLKVKYSNGVDHELRGFNLCSTNHIDAMPDGLRRAH